MRDERGEGRWENGGGVCHSPHISAIELNTFCDRKTSCVVDSALLLGRGRTRNQNCKAESYCSGMNNKQNKSLNYALIFFCAYHSCFTFFFIILSAICFQEASFHSLGSAPPRFPSGWGVRMESERSGVWFPLSLWGCFWVESYQWLTHWHSSGYPARRLALQGQRWDWFARCQCTVTEWGKKFDLQLLSQCGST